MKYKIILILSICINNAFAKVNTLTNSMQSLDSTQLEQLKKTNPNTYMKLAYDLGLTSFTPKKQVDLSKYVEKQGANIITIGPDAACDGTYFAMKALIETAPDGSEVHIASGTYSGDLANFNIVDKSITIIGGYSQDCQTLNSSAKTTISLTNAADEVIDVFPSSTEITVNLVNLVIEGGANNNGGIYIHNGSNATGRAKVYISNSVVRNNHGEQSGGIKIEGGSLFVESGSSIQSNKSDANGGGINCLDSEVFIANSIIGFNSADDNDSSSGDGGGVFLNNCDLLFHSYNQEESGIAFNTAINGGGIFATNSSEVFLVGQDSSLAFNQASFSPLVGGYGGGINIEDNSQLSIFSAKVEGNRSFYGAGVYIGTNSSLLTGRNFATLEECTSAQCTRIVNNEAISDDTNIAYSFAGGIYAESTADVTINQAWISGNKADFSSALSFKANNSSVKHSMIINNTTNAKPLGNIAATVGIQSGPHVDFMFNTLAGNVHGDISAPVLSVSGVVSSANIIANIIQDNTFVTAPLSVEVNNIATVVDCKYNLLEANTAVDECNHISNLDVGNEAAFVDAANNNFHISSQSLAIDHASAVPTAVDERDIDNDVIIIADAGADEAPINRVGINGGTCSYSTINEALLDAVDGDILYLKPSTYNETLFLFKDINLNGASQDCTSPIADNTSNTVIIDGTGVTDNTALLVIQGNKKITLNNLTVQNSSRGGISKNDTDIGDNDSDLILTNVNIFSNTSNFNGAGIKAGKYARVELRGDTNISNNFTFTQGSKGGGIYVDTGGTLKIFDNVTIGKANQENIAGNGGGVYINSATIEMHDNSQISANSAFLGGGVYLNGEQSLFVSFPGTSMRLNQADDGGAVYSHNASVSGSVKYVANTALNFGGAVYIERNNGNSYIDWFDADFEMNHSQDAGGAIYIKGNIDNISTRIILSKVSFINNTAVNKGGALFLGENNEVITSGSLSCQEHTGIGFDFCSQFVGNSTVDVLGKGGAIYNKGVLRIDKTSFKQNKASNGSIIYFESFDGIYRPSLYMRSSLISENFESAALHSEDVVSASVFSSTMVDNFKSISISGGLSLYRSIIWGDDTSSSIDGQFSGECNIDEFGILSDNMQDPLFETDVNGINYLLSVNSPAIDKCQTAVGGISDLLGNSRSLDGNYHASSNEGDMGAFVYIPSGSKQLSVTKSGTGTGTVISQFGDINCGSTCSDEYPLGMLVTLQATADTNMQFVGWSGSGCSGTGNCTVLVSEERNVTAQFNTVAPLQELIFINGFE